MGSLRVKCRFADARVLKGGDVSTTLTGRRCLRWSWLESKANVPAWCREDSRSSRNCIKHGLLRPCSFIAAATICARFSPTIQPRERRSGESLNAMRTGRAARFDPGNAVAKDFPVRCIAPTHEFLKITSRIAIFMKEWPADRWSDRFDGAFELHGVREYVRLRTYGGANCRRLNVHPLNGKLWARSRGIRVGQNMIMIISKMTRSRALLSVA